MRAIYDAADGDPIAIVDSYEVCETAGVPPDRVEGTITYLANEGLLEWASTTGGVSITHAGVVEVEEGEARPDRPTAHFPPVNIINIGTMTNSQIQQGSTGATQSMSLTEGELSAARVLIDLLSERQADLDRLDRDVAEELQAEMQTLQAQLSSPKPKRSVVSEAAKTIRAIIEGAGGEILADALPKLLPLLAVLT